MDGAPDSLIRSHHVRNCPLRTFTRSDPTKDANLQTGLTRAHLSFQYVLHPSATIMVIRNYCSCEVRIADGTLSKALKPGLAEATPTSGGFSARNIQPLSTSLKIYPKRILTFLTFQGSQNKCTQTAKPHEHRTLLGLKAKTQGLPAFVLARQAVKDTKGLAL